MGRGPCIIWDGRWTPRVCGIELFYTVGLCAQRSLRHCCVLGACCDIVDMPSYAWLRRCRWRSPTGRPLQRRHAFASGELLPYNVLGSLRPMVLSSVPCLLAVPGDRVLNP